LRIADIPSLEWPEDILHITGYILESKRESFDPGYLDDRYRTVLVEKLKGKRAQELPARAGPSPPSARNVINLMEALKASLWRQKPPAPSKTRRQRPGPR
jgi:non-homologous end joining protein Ku